MKIFVIILLVLPLFVFSPTKTMAQTPLKISELPAFSGDPTPGQIPITIGSNTFKISPDKIGVWDMYLRNDSLFKSRSGIEQFVMKAVSTLFNGSRPITRDFSTITGVNLNTTDIQTTLSQLLYPSQPATASLTTTIGANTGKIVVVEKTGAATINGTLNYTAGRQAYTEEILKIVVNGQGKSFTQPAPGASVTGTQAVTIPSNNDISYTNAVTTVDNLLTVVNTTVDFQTKWYYGFVAPSVTNPTNADILGLSGSAFTTVRTKPATTVSNTYDQKLVIAFDATLDPSAISQIWVGGLNSTAAFTRTVQSFTNASGYVTNYIVFIQNTSTASGLTFEIK